MRYFALLSGASAMAGVVLELNGYPDNVRLGLVTFWSVLMLGTFIDMSIRRQ